MTRVRLALAVLVSPAPALLAQWSPPQAVTSVNTTFAEGSPTLTFDGLTLYYTSYQSLLGEIHRATRTSRYGAFGAPAALPELSSIEEDWSPTVRIDDREIIFSSQRPGGGGGGPYDLWRADRATTAGPFNPPVPVLELNSTANEYSPSLTGNGLRIYFTSSRAGGLGNVDIWTATRASWSSPFGTATPVVELNSSSTDRDPRVSADDLVIFFSSTRAGGDDFWMASRLSTSLPFGTPVLVTGLNTTLAERNPGLAAFPDELVFSSTRSGGAGSHDIFVSRFTGLVGSGHPGPASAQSLLFSDPGSPRHAYVAASSLGTTPGIQFGTRVLPLNYDGLMSVTLGGLPPLLNGYLGVLDGDGVATGSITFPGLPQLVGLRFHTAFVVADPPAPFGIKTISNALGSLVQ